MDILKRMAKITPEAVKYLGQLARIRLSNQEIATRKAEISSVLEYVGKLQSVKTQGIVPTSQVTGLSDVWRPDKPWTKPWNRQELLKNVPQTKDGYIKVPKVL